MTTIGFKKQMVKREQSRTLLPPPINSIKKSI